VALGNFFKRAKDTVIGLARKASETLILGVQKTARSLRNGLDFIVGRKLDEENSTKLWEALIAADVSPTMADQLVERPSRRSKTGSLRSATTSCSS